MSKVCQPVKVRWYEIVNDRTHILVGEDECTELRDGLYFEFEGQNHSVTATFTPIVAWDVSRLDIVEVRDLLSCRDHRGLLNLYNKTYGYNICCPSNELIASFEAIIKTLDNEGKGN